MDKGLLFVSGFVFGIGLLVVIEIFQGLMVFLNDLYYS